MLIASEGSDCQLSWLAAGATAPVAAPLAAGVNYQRPNTAALVALDSYTSAVTLNGRTAPF